MMVCRNANCVPSGAAGFPNAVSSAEVPIETPPFGADHGDPAGNGISVPAATAGNSNPPSIRPKGGIATVILTAADVVEAPSVSVAFAVSEYDPGCTFVQTKE